MKWKPGYKTLILQAPENYLEGLAGIDQLHTKPNGEQTHSFDMVHLFVHNKAEVDQWAPLAFLQVKHDGLLWISYPKGTSKIKTDINRDKGWDALLELGLEGVAQVSIDNTWSAGRFRPASLVKRKG